MIDQFQKNQSALNEDKTSGELTLVNLDTARYFTLNDSASVIWWKLDQLHDLASVEEWAKLTFCDENTNVGDEIETFIRQLVEHQLLVPMLEKTSDRTTEDLAESLSNVETKTRFVTPLLSLGPNLDDLISSQ